MDQFQTQLQPYFERANTFLSAFPLLLRLEKQVGCSRVYVAAVLWTLVSASLFAGFQPVADSLALAWPLAKLARGDDQRWAL